MSARADIGVAARDAGNHQQRIGALFGFGRALADTPRGKAVARVLYLRGLRSWVTPYCYAWFRLTDDINAARGELARIRACKPIRERMPA